MSCLRHAMILCLYEVVAWLQVLSLDNQRMNPIFKVKGVPPTHRSPRTSQIFQNGIEYLHPPYLGRQHATHVFHDEYCGSGDGQHPQVFAIKEISLIIFRTIIQLSPIARAPYQ